MRTSTFNYIKDILADYPELDDYIKKRTRQLRMPGAAGDGLRVTIEADFRLACLERNRNAVAAALAQADCDTRVIIAELYLKRRPRFTMQGLVTNGLIHVGRTKAFQLREDFFSQIARALDLDY